jgi:hypothetical protein
MANRYSKFRTARGLPALPPSGSPSIQVFALPG